MIIKNKIIFILILAFLILAPIKKTDASLCYVCSSENSGGGTYGFDFTQYNRNDFSSTPFYDDFASRHYGESGGLIGPAENPFPREDFIKIESPFIPGDSIGKSTSTPGSTGSQTGGLGTPPFNPNGNSGTGSGSGSGSGSGIGISLGSSGPVPVDVVRDFYTIPRTMADARQSGISKQAIEKILVGLKRTLATARTDERTGAKVPAFVEDWRDFTRNAQDAGRNGFRVVLGEATLSKDKATVCPYIAESLANTFGAKAPSGGLEEINLNKVLRTGDTEGTFANQIKCTLPKTVIVDGKTVPFNPNTFAEDFNHGGWEAFSAFVSNPSNTFLGAYNASLGEKESQTSSQKDWLVNEAISGNGYLGIKDEHGKILTPGAFLSEAHKILLSAPIDTLIGLDSATDAFPSSPETTISSLVSGLLKSLGISQEIIDIAKKVAETVGSALNKKGVPEIPDPDPNGQCTIDSCADVCIDPTKQSCNQ